MNVGKLNVCLALWGRKAIWGKILVSAFNLHFRNLTIILEKTFLTDTLRRWNMLTIITAGSFVQFWKVLVVIFLLSQWYKISYTSVFAVIRLNQVVN